MNAVSSNADEAQFNTLSISADILQMSFSNLQVVRELSITHKRQTKYIDLFLIDPYQQLVIVIERKDGSLAKNNQLFNYADWAEAHYEGWKHVFILSDSYGLDHKKQYDKRYIQLDDTWLTDALLDLISRGKVTSYQETKFRDIHDYIFGRWSEKRDDYYLGFDKILKQVAESHCETLRALENHCVKFKRASFNLLDISKNTYFAKILPNAQSIDCNSLKLLELVQRYSPVFNQLHGLNEFDEFEDKLKNLNKYLVTELHADNIYFTLKHHLPSTGCWPIAFEVKRIVTEEDETGYELNLTISKYSDEAYHSLAEKAAKAFGKSFKQNQKRLPIKQLVLVEDLDLSIGSKLVKEINSSLNKISIIAC